MSKLVDSELVDRMRARSVNAGAEVAGAIDVDAIASAVNDEVRHGKPGTVRSANAVFVHRVDLRLRELADLVRSRAREREKDQSRYAQLWIEILDTAVSARPSPRALASALRFWRDHGFPKLNPDIPARLEALGERWPSQVLPAAPAREMTKSPRPRAPREGKHARAHAKAH